MLFSISPIPTKTINYGGKLMTVEQYQRTVNTLDKEIAALEKKKSELDKKCADLDKKITTTRKSITPRTSASTAQSKLKQIASWGEEHAKKSAESAAVGKKIAEKRAKRNEAYLKLQKAEQAEQKKRDREAERLRQSYEERISELQELTFPTPAVSLAEHTEGEEYDVFVSHAWEDKDSFVNEFVDELRKLGINVWYDQSEIKWGDSMRAKIDNGLRTSKFGIVVLSPDYIKEGKYWTKAELDGLFQLESINGKSLLPIWHNLTKKEVMNFSPIIASKLAMNTASLTPAEIASEMLKLLPEKT